MSKPKLFRLLSSFESEEIRQLKLLAEAPFLFQDCKRPFKAQALLNYLLQWYPRFDEKGIDEVEMCAAVYPDQQFSKSKLTPLLTDVVKALMRFIVIYQPEALSEQSYWLKQVQFFEKRQLDTEYKYAVGRMEKALQTAQVKEDDYYYNQFKFEIAKTRYALRKNNKKTAANLPQVIRALDLFYAISKMDFCSNLQLQMLSTNLTSEQSMLLLEELLALVKGHYLDIPILSAFYHAFPLLDKNNNGEGKDYERLNAILERHPGEFSKEKLKTLHNYMRTYLTYQYIRGKVECLPKLFELFKDQILQGTIYQDKHMVFSSTLQNAITVALKLGEYEWAYGFLLDHKNYITGIDDPNSLFQFNLANIYFHQGLYEKTEAILQKYHFRDLSYNLAVRRLEIKLLYETRALMSLFKAKLNNFKSFMHEQKGQLPKSQFAPNDNFYKYVHKIYNVLKWYDSDHIAPEQKDDRSIKKIEKIIHQLDEEKMIAEREWLYEKLKMK